MQDIEDVRVMLFLMKNKRSIYLQASERLSIVFVHC